MRRCTLATVENSVVHRRNGDRNGFGSERTTRGHATAGPSSREGAEEEEEAKEVG